MTLFSSTRDYGTGLLDIQPTIFAPCQTKVTLLFLEKEGSCLLICNLCEGLLSSNPRSFVSSTPVLVLARGI